MATTDADFLISPNYRNVPNLTTTNHYVHRGGSAGQAGEIPIVEYLRKLEQTCVYEPENMVDQHNRRTLKDRTPEAPTLASDLTRRDNHSKEILSLRHNFARTAAEPIHPDLMLGFTDRDPRGMATDPNMRKVALQSATRMKFKDLKNDNLSDAQITGGNRSNQTIIKDFRATVSGAKKRWNWFSTSLDGRANRVIMPSRSTNKRSNAELVEDQTQHLSVNDSSQATRDRVIKLSNDLPIGSRTTVSHKFDIADYSQVRASKAIIQNDFRKVMDNTITAHDAGLSKEDTNRAIAYVMSTIAHKEVEKDGKISAPWKEYNHHSSVVVADVRKALDTAECSEINPANMLFQHYIQNPQKRTVVCTDRLGRVGEIDQTQMALIKEMKANRNGVFHFDPHLMWDTEKDQTNARGFKTHVYKSTDQTTNRVAVDELEETQSSQVSRNTQDRAVSHVVQEVGAGREVDATADRPDATFKNRHASGLGQKSKVKYYGIVDNKTESIGDTESMVRRAGQSKRTAK